jgi:hypothetical protein
VTLFLLPSSRRHRDGSVSRFHQLAAVHCTQCLSSLDSPLHSSILTSLAHLYASPSLPDPDLSCLLSGTAPVSHDPLGTPTTSTSGRLSLAQIDSNIAFARYVSLSPSEAHVSTLLSLMRNLPHFQLESAVGFLGPDDAPLPSQLAFAISSSALSLPSQFATEESLVEFYTDLQAQILSENVTPARLINHLLPLLHGFVSSLESTSRRFSSSTTQRFLFPTRVDITRLGDKLASQIDQTSADGRETLTVLSRYSAMGRPLGPGMWAWETLRAKALVSANLVDERGWEGLVVDATPDSSGQALGADLEECLKTYREMLEIAPAERDKESPDGEAESEYALDSLVESLVRRIFVTVSFAFPLMIKLQRLATLAALADAKSQPRSSQTPDEKLLGVLKRLTSESAGIFEARVQCVALEALIILVRKYARVSHHSDTILPRANTCRLLVVFLILRNKWSSTSDDLSLPPSLYSNPTPAKNHPRPSFKRPKPLASVSTCWIKTISRLRPPTPYSIFSQVAKVVTRHLHRARLLQKEDGMLSQSATFKERAGTKRRWSASMCFTSSPSLPCTFERTMYVLGFSFLFFYKSSISYSTLE